MPQHDYILDNQPGAAFRADLNAALAAIAQLNSGATAPATTYPYMPWMDTSVNVLKQRNAGNSAWLAWMIPWGGLGTHNTLSGIGAGAAYTTGTNVVAMGDDAAHSNTSGSDMAAFGSEALYSNTTGNFNTAVGHAAGYAITTGAYNTAIGHDALYNSVSHNNVSGFGYGAVVTGSNQVQLGNASTTTYVYGTVQNRSDLRDKADVRDTTLGLGFINALRPVDYRWDLRDSYRAPLPDIPETATNAERAAITAAHLEANALANITRDGSKKRNRYHHGLIAQEVAAVIQATGVDFGGFQDHSVQGGEDVLSLGYDEFVAPLIRAVQELSARVVELEARLSA